MEDQTQPIKLKTSPKDFFLQLLAIITLYASAVSFGTVLFQWINIVIPDPLTRGENYIDDRSRYLLRNALSFLIVMFPVYAAISWYLQNLYTKDVAKRNLRVRRWLIYFTIFAAAIIILISLANLVNTFLNGELTLRFGLKILTVFFIAGTIFSYYFCDIKKYQTE